LLPFAVCGLFTGAISDKASSRKCYLGIFSILWSSATIVSSYTSSFAVFATMRVLLGILESASNPLIFSLIRDYFPPSHRSTANSILTSSIYLGTTISSLSILIISNYGWKISYRLTGGFGVLAGILVLLCLREPKRGIFDIVKIKDTDI